MIIPLNHENMQGRRWPYVTIGIIALNAIAFLATNSTINRETKEMGQVREHILLLAAAHPKTPMNAVEQISRGLSPFPSQDLGFTGLA